MKMVLKIILLTIIATFVFILFSALVPYSEGFKVASSAGNASSLLYLLLMNLWLCVTIVFLVQNSTYAGRKLLLRVTFTLVMVYSFMTQIETWFFADAFPILTRFDIVLIALVNAIPIVVLVPLVMKFFPRKNQNPVSKTVGIGWDQRLFATIVLLGFGYMLIYFVFGYFVAWQSEALRIFYSGQPEKLGFVAKLIANYQEQPVIYLFQFIRGILFVLFVLPLVSLVGASKKNLLISLVLIYLSTGIVLIIPNILFPAAVRWAHFFEMIGSMFCLALLNWFVLSRSDQINW